MTQPPGDPHQQQPDDQPRYPPAADPFQTSARPGYSVPPGSQPPGSPPPAFGPPQGSPPPYGPPTSGFPYAGSPTPPPASGLPYSGPPTAPIAGQPPFAGPPSATYPGGFPPGGFPPATQSPKKKRGLLIALIALGVAVLLCGGGGTAAYFYLQDQDGTGASSATTAVNDFLQAVYSEGDVAKAEKLVCARARDRKDLTRKISAIKDEAKKHQGPSYTWTEPTVLAQRADSADVSVQVKLTTDDEKVAEQKLDFTVVKKTGWFVCEVRNS